MLFRSRAHLLKLAETKPVVAAGDMNVAHQEIDLKNPKTNRKNAGFTDEERNKMSTLLDSGFVDTFRYFYPDAEGIYSWWSYRFKAREKNAGWRIDYFIASESMKDRLAGAKNATYTSHHPKTNACAAKVPCAFILCQMFCNIEAAFLLIGISFNLSFLRYAL